MQSFIDPKLLERLRIGSLAQYCDLYLARIEEEGFSTVRAFLNRDPGVVHYPERATIHRLVAILRDIGECLEKRWEVRA
jgi:hypothetical protein